MSDEARDLELSRVVRMERDAAEIATLRSHLETATAERDEARKQRDLDKQEWLWDIELKQRARAAAIEMQSERDAARAALETARKALEAARKWFDDIATLPRDGCTECDGITATHAIKVSQDARSELDDALRALDTGACGRCDGCGHRECVGGRCAMCPTCGSPSRSSK